MNDKITPADDTMEKRHEQWNETHKGLRQLMAKPANRDDYLSVFLSQHAMVHAGIISASSQPTFEDELWNGLPEEAIRKIPEGMEHSIAWCMWHLARIEDVTMRILVSGQPQLLNTENWCDRLRTRFRTIGNEMTPSDIEELSQTLDISALRDYRNQAAIHTREIASSLPPSELPRKTPAHRIQILYQEGVLTQASQEVADYWGGLTVAGLLLMPPTRHNLIHINECMKIKKKVLGRDSCRT